MLGLSRVTFLQVCFFYVFQSPSFVILTLKSPPKWRQTRPKIDEKMMSVAILKKVFENVPNIFDFLLLFNRPMCLKHGKYCIRITFSLFADNPETYEKAFKHDPKN